MQRGDLRWGAPMVPGLGRKRRPFLIVSNDGFNLNDRYPKVLVVHLTTKRRGMHYDWDVPIPKGAGGVPAASVAKCNEVYTVLKVDLDEHIGTLPPLFMGAVTRALALVLSVPVALPAND